MDYEHVSSPPVVQPVVNTGRYNADDDVRMNCGKGGRYACSRSEVITGVEDDDVRADAASRGLEVVFRGHCGHIHTELVGCSVNVVREALLVGGEKDPHRSHRHTVKSRR